MKYCIGVGKNRQCECIIGGITIDGHVDNLSDYPVINWPNQLNKNGKFSEFFSKHFNEFQSMIR